MEVFAVIFSQTRGAGGRGKCPVGLHQHVWGNSCHLSQNTKTTNVSAQSNKTTLPLCCEKRTSLQPVDVLRVHPEQLALLVKQTHKVVSQIRLVVPWIQLSGQSEEGVWVSMKEFYLKNGLGVGQVVLLQVIIQTTARRPETPGYASNLQDSGHPQGFSCRLLYLKSGMPLGVLIPAPAITTTRLYFFSWMFLVMSSRVCCVTDEPLAQPRERNPLLPFHRAPVCEAAKFVLHQQRVNRDRSKQESKHNQYPKTLWCFDFILLIDLFLLKYCSLPFINTSTVWVVNISLLRQTENLPHFMIELKNGTLQMYNKPRHW